MKARSRGLFQLIFLLVFVFVLIRFFPVLARIAQAAALGSVELGWIILVFALGGWLVWVLSKRNSG